MSDLRYYCPWCKTQKEPTTKGCTQCGATGTWIEWLKELIKRGRAKEPK